MALPSATDEDIVIVGLRRSGIHAITSWLVPHLTGVTRLINDHDLALDGGRDPLAGAPTVYFQSRLGQASEIVRAEDMARETSDAITAGLDEFVASSPLWIRPFAGTVLRKFRRAQLGGAFRRHEAIPYRSPIGPAFADRNLFVVENMGIGDLSSQLPRWRREVYAPYLVRLGLAPARRLRVIQVIREPWNQLASLLKRCPERAARVIRPGEFLPAWLEFAREFAGVTARLKPIAEVERVSYPRWFTSARHRSEIARGLGLPPTESGVEIVSRFGGGSSFEGQAMSGQAQRMKVGDRWKAYADHPLMRDLCSCAEATELSRTIFGEAPPCLG